MSLVYVSYTCFKKRCDSTTVDITCCDCIYCFIVGLQDALFFLKDFFSNLAAGINPYLPVDPAAEGKLQSMNMLVFFFLSFPFCVYICKVHPVFIL